MKLGSVVAGILILIVLAGIFLSIMMPVDTYEELHDRKSFDAVLMLFLFPALLIAFEGVSPAKKIFTSIVITGGVYLLLCGFHSAILKMRATVSKAFTTQNLMLQIEIGLHQFKKDCGRYPTNEEGIEALFENPNVKGWRGPYLDIPTTNDAWGEKLILVTEKKTYTLSSKGKDRILGTQDDLIRQSTPD